MTSTAKVLRQVPLACKRTAYSERVEARERRPHEAVADCEELLASSRTVLTETTCSNRIRDRYHCPFRDPGRDGMKAHDPKGALHVLVALRKFDNKSFENLIL